MKISNVEVTGFEAAIRSMRMPMESHARSDSKYWLPNFQQEEYEKIVGDNVIWDPYYLGENDRKLAKRLCDGGEPHRKFLRYIHVSMNISASQIFFSQYDTYKIATVANSTSKMHKLASTPITLDRFEMGDNEELNWKDPDGFMEEYNSSFVWDTLIDALESLRRKYNETKDIRYWNELLRLLPESWIQTRTVDLNYEVLRTMYYWRADHKWYEWREFCAYIAENLPYAGLLITGEEEE